VSGVFNLLPIRITALLLPHDELWGFPIKRIKKPSLRGPVLLSMCVNQQSQLLLY
jgi:hypothetical protein